MCEMSAKPLAVPCNRVSSRQPNIVGTMRAKHDIECKYTNRLVWKRSARGSQLYQKQWDNARLKQGTEPRAIATELRLEFISVK